MHFVCFLSLKPPLLYFPLTIYLFLKAELYQSNSSLFYGGFWDETSMIFFVQENLTQVLVVHQSLALILEGINNNYSL